MNIVIGILLISLMSAAGAYANPYWKMFDKADTYANGFYRAILGIPIWVAMICVFTKSWDIIITMVLIVIAMLAIPAIRMNKDGYNFAIPLIIIFFAATGVYARIILAWTFVGLPVNAMLKKAAEEGWESLVENLMKNAGGNVSKTDPWADLMAMMEEDRIRREKEEQEREQRENQEKVEVYRRNGFFIENLKVSRDQKSYYDPDDEEWKQIKK